MELEGLMRYSMKDAMRAITTAGITIAVAFVGSALVFANSHYHTGQREGSWSALAASSWLELAWVVVGSIFAIIGWRTTSLLFRTVLLVNLAITGLLIADFWVH